jgi:hypothetical protein
MFFWCASNYFRYNHRFQIPQLYNLSTKTLVFQFLFCYLRQTILLTGTATPTSKWKFSVLCYHLLYPNYMDRDISVGTAHRHRLDGPDMESRWGKDFRQPHRPAMGPTQPTVNWEPVVFLGGKATGECRQPSTSI